ncbi:MAG: thioredoxin domain-containing protein [Alphaproteobacteria bacterium]
MLKKILSVFLVLFSFTLVGAKANGIVRTLGHETAPVVIQEFSSLTCPYCAKFHKEIYPELVKKYVETGKVRIVYRNYPLDNVAMAAAMLGLSIDKRKYFAYLQYAYQNQTQLTQTPLQTLHKWANMAGLSKAQTDKILKNNNLLNAIVADMKKIDKIYNLKGTPLIYIGTTQYQGKLNKKDFFAELDKVVK